MDLLHPQLAAFAAVLEEGSFDAAARRLSVTPSAISQRVKALEDRLGQVLVIRKAPCRPTPAGERLLRRVKPMQVLESEAIADFLPGDGSAGHPRTLAIAVNDDSLQTWFLAALSALHREHGVLFDVQMDDQDHTLELLRSGAVLGAVTAERKPLQGCNVQALGVMRYHAIASAAFVATHFKQGFSAAALAHAPMLVFNRKDTLQTRFVRRITRTQVAPPIHYLPTSTGFVEAAARGLGWCLAPESMVVPAVRNRQVVIIDPTRWLDVPLYWQCAAVRSSALQQLGQALRKAAAASLR
ncbi:LysR family transcriptional regulator ArgP [Xanthomonas arboricola]|uniref:LysR family transcriptional regulator ArgP n=1 Tax=Xanthomonas arboricola TaxID=56448 RepID=UPI000C855E02|nr:LysR family transcriptional regulator ArgP [Xanthomonas arboricola]MBB4604673.1 LysR family transcriptional regulator (chromosome initiation inhibitor) [Xanthomonas arboricola]SOT96108.1 Transcriptional regulator [Xanthomonas arboricola pv. fragariae]